jgi:hypothetical protein
MSAPIRFPGRVSGLAMWPLPGLPTSGRHLRRVAFWRAGHTVPTRARWPMRGEAREAEIRRARQNGPSSEAAVGQFPGTVPRQEAGLSARGCFPDHWLQVRGLRVFRTCPLAGRPSQDMWPVTLETAPNAALSNGPNVLAARVLKYPWSWRANCVLLRGVAGQPRLLSGVKRETAQAGI